MSDLDRTNDQAPLSVPCQELERQQASEEMMMGVRDGESSLSVIGSRCSTSAEIKVKIYFLLATNGSQAMRISILIAKISLSVYLPYFLSYFQLVACVLA